MRNVVVGRGRVAHALAMTVVGIAALVVTYLVTGSLWWALLALLLAGPAAQILARPRRR